MSRTVFCIYIAYLAQNLHVSPSLRVSCRTPAERKQRQRLHARSLRIRSLLRMSPPSDDEDPVDALQNMSKMLRLWTRSDRIE